MIDPNDVDKLLGLAEKRAANYDFLFDRLTSPDWLDALDARGVFSDPPAPVEVEGGVLFPEWAPARYLLRVASLPEAQASVLEVVLRVPRTENVRVHLQLLEILLKLPTQLAVKAMDVVVDWLSGDHAPLDVRRYADLAVKLARDDDPDTAIRLTRRILEPVAASWGSPGVAGIGYWELGRVLETLVSPLADASLQESLAMFSDVLESAIRDREAVADAPTASGYVEDNSWLWRPAIGDHEQNFDYEDILDAFVAAVRDTAVHGLGADPSLVMACIGALEARPLRVFHRIALHLLREFPDSAVRLVAERLTDRALFDDVGVWHEYYHLQQDCFGMLDSQQQAIVLDWIEAGPPSDDLPVSSAGGEGSELADEHLDAYAAQWRLRKLTPIASYLPAAWKVTYEELVRQLGEPEHPDFLSYHTSWTGPTSPTSIDELKAMAPTELVGFLRAWEPPGEWEAPTPEGLGRLLTAVVADNPEQYAATATQYVGMESTYVRGLVEGLRTAAQDKKRFDWTPVLSLAGQVVLDPWETAPASKDLRDRDPDWSWTRKAIAGLLGAGLQAYDGNVSFSDRSPVWEVLRPLTDDSDPSPEDEERRASGGFNPMTVAINTVRGTALHAVVRYGLWVKRSHDTLAEGEGAAPRQLDLDEVWEVLDEHLDVKRDPSLAVRSVYGQWFPWLHVLDAEWAMSHRRLIFPADPILWKHWDAAWNTYIVACPPFDDVFQVLRGEYERAVDSMGSKQGRAYLGDRPDERLGEHLAAFVWRGVLLLDPVDSLFATFWSKATPILREHVLEYVGRSIRDWPPNVDADVMDRLRRLWEYAFSSPGAVAVEEKPSVSSPATQHEEPLELAAFAWWFDSGKFDDEWSLAELDRVLERTSLINPAFMIARKLAVLVERHPRRSVSALARLVDSDREGWRITGWQDDALKIVEHATKSGDEDATRIASDVANRLVARGRLEFRSLAEEGRTGRSDDSASPDEAES